MMQYLGISIFANIVLVIYLLYIYLYKGELRKNVEYLEVEPEIPGPPVDDCQKCLDEHKDMIEQINKLKEDITKLVSTNRNLNQTATTIRYGMDRLMQAATRSNVTIN
jgi:hypothetical protein